MESPMQDLSSGDHEYLYKKMSEWYAFILIKKVILFFIDLFSFQPYMQ